jgi:hypothetical protein
MFLIGAPSKPNRAVKSGEARGGSIKKFLVIATLATVIAAPAFAQ